MQWDKRTKAWKSWFAIWPVLILGNLGYRDKWVWLEWVEYQTVWNPVGATAWGRGRYERVYKTINRS